MAGVINGQAVDAAVTNPAFLIKNADDVTYNHIGLAASDSATIDDLQGTINVLLDAVGGTQSVPATAYPGVPSNTIASGDTHQLALIALAEKFFGTSLAGGHTHSGVDGDGAVINAVQGIGASGYGFLTGNVTFAVSGGGSIVQSGNVITIVASSGTGGGGGELTGEIPSGTIDGSNQNFVITGSPGGNSVIPVVGGTVCLPSEYSYNSGTKTVTLYGEAIPYPGQQVFIMYSVAAGGGGGSSTIEAHGSAASPIAITPSMGISPTTANDQVWWVKPSTGTGAVPITAASAIASGSTIGQRLTIKSPASANYLVIPDAANTDLNGACDMGPFTQSIELVWNGTVWDENTRRV